MNKNNLAPIVLFVYNRPEHTRKTVTALKNNKLALDSEIFIYCDGPKNRDAIESVNAVRKFIQCIDGFKKITIIEREKNWGLANSIIDGVTDIVNRYGRVIVLEDDLVTSSYFLQYMNDALTLYNDDEIVASIHAYIYPIRDLPETFFIKGADCWGWATWSRAWEDFEQDGKVLLEELKARKLENEADFNGSYQYTKMLEKQISGENDSWAVRWYISCFLRNAITLYPGRTYVENIGNDGSGTHCSKNNLFFQKVNDNYRKIKKIVLEEDQYSKQKMERFFNSTSENIFLRFIRLIKGIIK